MLVPYHAIYPRDPGKILIKNKRGWIEKLFYTLEGQPATHIGQGRWGDQEAGKK